MEHNIIHHTESVPVREPLTEEQADKLIEQASDGLAVTEFDKVYLRSLLAGSSFSSMHFTMTHSKRLVIRQVFDRIEEARAHGLA